MQGDYPHWIRLSNDNPENAVGKCRHLAQAMFQFRIELIILDYNSEGKVTGIEMLYLSKRVSSSQLGKVEVEPQALLAAS